MKIIKRWLARFHLFVASCGKRWESFNGQQTDFPNWQRTMGIPLDYQVRMKDGRRLKACIVGVSPHNKFRQAGSWDDIPTDQVEAWRCIDKVWRTGFRLWLLEKTERWTY